METNLMGRVVVRAVIENAYDLRDVERGLLPAEQVRRLEVEDALVDTGATTLSMPKRLIEQLGLAPLHARRVRTSAGPQVIQVYCEVRLTIQGGTASWTLWRPTTNAPCSLGRCRWNCWISSSIPKCSGWSAIRPTAASTCTKCIEVRYPPHSFVPGVGPLQRLADRPEYLSPRHRFRQHRKRLLAPGLLQQPFVPLGRQQDARQHRPKLLHQPQRLQPGQLRHVHVQQQQMDLFAAENMEGLLAVAGQQGAETLRLEHHLQRLAEVRVVVGDQQ